MSDTQIKSPKSPKSPKPPKPEPEPYKSLVGSGTIKFPDGSKKTFYGDSPGDVDNQAREFWYKNHARPAPPPPKPSQEQVDEFSMKFFNTFDPKANVPMQAAHALAKNPKDPLWLPLVEKMHPISQEAIQQKAKRIAEAPVYDSTPYGTLGTFGQAPIYRYPQPSNEPIPHGFMEIWRSKGTRAPAPEAHDIIGTMIHGPEGYDQLKEATGAAAELTKFAESLADPQNVLGAMLGGGAASLGGKWATAALVAPYVLAAKPTYDKIRHHDYGGAAVDAILPFAIHGAFKGYQKFKAGQTPPAAPTPAEPAKPSALGSGPKTGTKPPPQAPPPPSEPPPAEPPPGTGSKTGSKPGAKTGSKTGTKGTKTGTKTGTKSAYDPAAETHPEVQKFNTHTDKVYDRIMTSDEIIQAKRRIAELNNIGNRGVRTKAETAEMVTLAEDLGRHTNAAQGFAEKYNAATGKTIKINPTDEMRTESPITGREEIFKYARAAIRSGKSTFDKMFPETVPQEAPPAEKPTATKPAPKTTKMTKPAEPKPQAAKPAEAPKPAEAVKPVETPKPEQATPATDVSRETPEALKPTKLPRYTAFEEPTPVEKPSTASPVPPAAAAVKPATAAPETSKTQSLEHHVQEAHSRLEAMLKPHAGVAHSVLTKHEAKGIDTSDARDALDEFKEVVRSDYGSQEEYTEARQDAWENFVQTHGMIDASEVETPAPYGTEGDSAASFATIKNVEGEERVVMGMDPALIKTLRGNLYRGDIGKIALKETVQNAVDAVRHLGAEGKVTADMDTLGRELTIADNGHGMLPGVVTKFFVDAGASVKQGVSSGGLGIAKVAFLVNAETFKVVTTAKTPEGGYLETTLEGRGEDLINLDKGVKVTSKPVTHGNTGTTLHIKFADEASIDRWSSGSWADRFAQNHALEGTVKLKVDGVIKTRPSYLEPNNKLTTINPPGAKIDISASTKTTRSGYVSVEILNRGLPQYTHSVSLRGEAEMPISIVADVHATVGTDSQDYPFTADREGMKDAVKDAIENYIKTTLKGAALKGEIEKYKNALSSGVRLGRRGGGTTSPKLVDASGQVPADVLQEIGASPVLHSLSDAAYRVYGEMETLFSEYDPNYMLGAYRGLAFFPKNDGSTLGVNIAGVAVGSELNPVLLNPFATAEGVQSLVNSGKIKPEDAFSYFAQQMAATLLHEITHNVAREEGARFTHPLTENIGRSTLHLIKWGSVFKHALGKDGLDELDQINDLLSPYAYGDNLFKPVSANAQAFPKGSESDPDTRKESGTAGTQNQDSSKGNARPAKTFSSPKKGSHGGFLDIGSLPPKSGAGPVGRLLAYGPKLLDNFNKWDASEVTAQVRSQFMLDELFPKNVTEAQRGLIGEILVGQRIDWKANNSLTEKARENFAKHPQRLTPAQVAPYLNDPVIKDAVEKHRDAHVSTFNAIAKQAGISIDLDPRYVRLLPLKDLKSGSKDFKQFSGGRASWESKMRPQSSGARKRAMGTAEEYATDMGEVYRYDLRDKEPKARLNNVWRALEKQGLIAARPRGKDEWHSPKGYSPIQFQGKFSSVPKDLIDKYGEKETVYVPTDIWEVMHDITKPPSGDSGYRSVEAVKRISQLLVWAQLGTNIAAVPWHIIRQTAMVRGATEYADVKADPTKIVGSAFTPLGVAMKGHTIFSRDVDTPENRQIMLELIQANAISPRSMEMKEFEGKNPVSKAFKVYQHAQHDAMFGMPRGQGLNGWAIRSVLEGEIVRRQYENNKDPERMREFASNFGFYTRRLTPMLGIFSELNPFVRTTAARYIAGTKQMLGISGLKAPGGIKGQAAQWLGTFALKALGVGIGFLALNKMLSGHWPWENEKGHEIDLSLGNGYYVPLASLTVEMGALLQLTGMKSRMHRETIQKEPAKHRFGTPYKETVDPPSPLGQAFGDMTTGVANTTLELAGSPLLQASAGLIGRRPYLEYVNGQKFPVPMPSQPYKATIPQEVLNYTKDLTGAGKMVPDAGYPDMNIEHALMDYVMQGNLKHGYVRNPTRHKKFGR
jgi:hypothetical protein